MGPHPTQKKHLSAKGLLKKVHNTFIKIPEPARDPRGLKPRISMGNCLMSGLAMFSLKYPSLLQFDQGQEEPTTKHNLKTLYGIDAVPCDTYMRERLDKIDPNFLRSAFTTLFSAAQRGKVFESYRFLGKYLLVACDATGIFSSEKIHCNNCCEKHHKDGRITYYHQMLAGVVVHPDQSQVFPFCPEPISKKDGATKNDCEQNAMNRFLNDLNQEHPRLNVVITYDALSANGPCIKRIQKSGARFIIAAKPNGNKTLFEWLKEIELEEHKLSTQKETLQFRFINGIPLNNTYPDLEVNFFECLVKGKNGKMKRRFSWITDSAPQAHKKEVYENKLTTCT
jgi:hypothetical protein